MIMYFPFLQLLLDLPYLPTILTFYLFLCLKKKSKQRGKKQIIEKFHNKTKQKAYNHHLAHLVLVNYFWAWACPGIFLSILTMWGNLSFEYFPLL